MSRRRKQEPQSVVDAQPMTIAPWIDQWGNQVWHNPWGQYRPNPRLNVTMTPAEFRATAGLPAVTSATPAQAPATSNAGPATYPTVLNAATHPTTDDDGIAADDDRIRATIEYAKGYAKACKSLGIEIPDDMRDRLKIHTAQRRGRVHKRVRRTAAASIAVGAGFVGINAAAAYFTSSGQGIGSATAGTQQAVTVAATGTPTTKLIPNNGTADLALVVTNPNSYPVTITGVSQGVGAIGATGGIGTCTTTGVTIPTQTGLAVSVTAVNGASQTVHIANGAKMDTTSDSGCQNAKFTIPVSLTVKQS
jgi:hypothetical protein